MRQWQNPIIFLDCKYMIRSSIFCIGLVFFVCKFLSLGLVFGPIIYFIWARILAFLVEQSMI